MTWRLTATAEPSPDWQALMDKCDGNFYHSVEWGSAHVSPRSRPIYFHWSDDSHQDAGIAVGIERQSTARGIGQLFRRLDFESYPAIASRNPQMVRKAITDLLRFASVKGYRSFSVQSYATRMPDLEVEGIGLTPTPRIEFVVNLSLPDEELWKRLSSHHRRKIKRAGSNGLVFSDTQSIEALRESRAVQMRSRDRRVSRGESIPSGDDAAYERFGSRLFVSDVGRVFLASTDGEVVSAALIWVYRGTAFYLYGGSSDKGFELDAPGWLFWEGFKRCRELGCVEFNFGGVSRSAQSAESPSHGLFRFKDGFGGEQISCVSGHVGELNSRFKAVVAGIRDFRRPL